MIAGSWVPSPRVTKKLFLSGKMPFLSGNISLLSSEDDRTNPYFTPTRYSIHWLDRLLFVASVGLIVIVIAGNVLVSHPCILSSYVDPDLPGYS